MKKGLAVPLTMAQIEAANEFHQGLPQRKNTDDALHALHNRFPEFDIKATRCFGKPPLTGGRKS